MSILLSLIVAAPVEFTLPLLLSQHVATHK